MDAFIGPVRICQQRAAHAYLALLEALPDTMHSVPVPTGFTFCVPLGRPDGDYFLSITFPMDFPFAETALVLGDEMVHKADWGYDDIRRGFGSGIPSDPSTIDALVAEIRRLGMEAPGNPDDDDGESESAGENETYQE